MTVQSEQVAHKDLVEGVQTTLHSHAGGNGSSIIFSFKFEGGRLKAWDLCGSPSVWLTGGQRFWVDDSTGEVRIL